MPFEIVPDLLEHEQLAGEAPRETDPELLHQRGLEHWKRGELGPALAHLFALCQLNPSRPSDKLHRQKGLLGFAIAASALGRIRLSHRLIELLLAEPLHESLRVNVLCQAALNWADIGSNDLAMGCLDRAEAITKRSDHRSKAFIRHNRAMFLLAARQLAVAMNQVNRAIRAYRKAGDLLNALLAHGIKARILLASGEPAAALKLARRARREAEEEGLSHVAARRALDEAHALVALERADAALPVLNVALATAVEVSDRTLEFQVHFWLWKAYTSLGDATRADLQRETAEHLVRFVQDPVDEAKELRALGQKRKDVSPSRRPRSRRR
ncbi:MAG: hypothetical protein JSV80_17955 [Acidobacteriota bacterium]|nr:MAG: hypothetical protein JSV80_17955 [Acidobacteriota bacterium]